MTLPDLIAALEALGGPCRDMDDKIATAIWGEPQPMGNAGEPKTLYWEMSPGFYRSRSPRFTESLDAALTLAPEGWDWRVHSINHAVMMIAASGLDEHNIEAVAATPALATCIAALRARRAGAK